LEREQERGCPQGGRGHCVRWEPEKEAKCSLWICNVKRGGKGVPGWLNFINEIKSEDNVPGIRDGEERPRKGYLEGAESTPRNGVQKRTTLNR